MSGKWQRRIILTLGVLVIAAYVIGGGLRDWVRRERAEDLRDAVPREGIATVVSVVSGDKQATDHPNPWALVRYQGKLYSAQTAADPQALREGRQARIIYRLGRSGKVYVDRVEPLQAMDDAR